MGASAVGALLVMASFAVPHGFDLYAYWSVDPMDPYAGVGTEYGAFRYAPPIALLFAPLGWLPWELAVGLWLAVQLAGLYIIAGRWALALVLFPPVWYDLAFGNINIFLAAVIALGWRYPGIWAFALLTKVTPGVGVLWFAARREWRALGQMAAMLSAAIGGSLLTQGPDIWAQWFGVLAAAGDTTVVNALPIPLLPRLAVAAALVTVGALTDRKWTVTVAVTMAMPTLWPIAFVPLVAVLRR